MNNSNSTDLSKSVVFPGWSEAVGSGFKLSDTVNEVEDSIHKSMVQLDEAGIKAYDSYDIDPKEELGSRFPGWSTPVKD